MPLVWNEQLEGAIRRALAVALVRAAEEVRTEAIRLILSTQKTGRLYRRRGAEHQASAPGEPPATDTGRLVNSINTEVDTQNLVVRVTANAAHADALEFGTRNMEPRPFMRPALANKRDRIEEIIGEELRKVLKT